MIAQSRRRAASLLARRFQRCLFPPAAKIQSADSQTQRRIHSVDFRLQVKRRPFVPECERRGQTSFCPAERDLYTESPHKYSVHNRHICIFSYVNDTLRLSDSGKQAAHSHTVVELQATGPPVEPTALFKSKVSSAAVYLTSPHASSRKTQTRKNKQEVNTSLRKKHPRVFPPRATGN